MPEFASLTTTTLALLFAGSALVIAYFGSKMAGIADVLADRTGLGEALIGAVLLGAGTSISGIVTSISTAASGAPELAVSNALGGIAAQTMFLALADVAYRKVNLEHAGASAINLGQATVLIILTVLPIMAYAAPPFALFGINPLSPVLVAVYLIGLHNAHSIKQKPMWKPKETEDTRHEEDDEEDDARSTTVLALLFSGLVLIVGSAGYVVGETGLALSGRLGISQGVVGALGTAIVTSLPELVTTIAAVRCGALQLAIGGIIGGNMFDALFIAASDVAYRDGSIYHAISERSLFWMGLVALMTAILLLGLLRREKLGPGGIGWESVLLLGLWASGAALQVSLG
ncbi:sodium:calcium antiporter [Erythrobacter litoralis]|uniref:Cation antiporter (Na+/Ca2+) n=1 Tax=Erythrobacter litoralis (strain HTCC2594) TaxID=314225 RepID=Q2NA09_ERYLH|nr:cation transporter [Erythrobacter litoralis]ABC63482.1 cation antiporter (Na+/Ca2+) [Erythrobacter litoralis HTCC2594]